MRYWCVKGHDTLGMMVGAVGYLEDKAVTSILGVATTRDLIYFQHFKVYADIETVKDRFSASVMTSLNLSQRIEGDTVQGYTFIAERGMIGKSIISLSRDKSYHDVTDVKAVYFEQAKYNLRLSPLFDARMRRNSLFLRSIFYEIEPRLPCEIITNLTNAASDPLIGKTEDELQGYYSRYKRLPQRESFKILSLVLIALMTLGLWLSHQPDIYWQLSLVFDALIYLSQIPDLLRRK